MSGGLALYLIGAGICAAIIAYGITFAHFQGEFTFIAAARRSQHRQIAFVMACTSFVSWPLILPFLFFASDRCKHGLKFR